MSLPECPQHAGQGSEGQAVPTAPSSGGAAPPVGLCPATHTHTRPCQSLPLPEGRLGSAGPAPRDSGSPPKSPVLCHGDAQHSRFRCQQQHLLTPRLLGLLRRSAPHPGALEASESHWTVPGGSPAFCTQTLQAAPALSPCGRTFSTFLILPYWPPFHYSAFHKRGQKGAGNASNAAPVSVTCAERPERPRQNQGSPLPLLGCGLGIGGPRTLSHAFSPPIEVNVEPATASHKDTARAPQSKALPAPHWDGSTPSPGPAGHAAHRRQWGPCSDVRTLPCEVSWRRVLSRWGIVGTQVSEARPAQPRPDTPPRGPSPP